MLFVMEHDVDVMSRSSAAPLRVAAAVSSLRVWHASSHLL